MLAAEIRHKCVDRMRGCRHWRRHLDERFVTINGKTHCLWRAAGYKGTRHTHLQ